MKGGKFNVPEGNAFAMFGIGGLIGFGIREVVGWLGNLSKTMFPTEVNHNNQACNQLREGYYVHHDRYTSHNDTFRNEFSDGDHPRGCISRGNAATLIVERRHEQSGSIPGRKSASMRLEFINLIALKPVSDQVPGSRQLVR